MIHKTDKGHAAPAARQRAQSGLDAESRRAIGTRLQALYDQVVREPIPDRFTDLLKRLEAEEDTAPET